MPKAGGEGSTRRRRWTEPEARAALSGLEESGLSVVAFAKREGVSEQTIYRWRARLAPSATAVDATPPLVEIQRGAVGLVEVVLRSGLVLRVSESIDAAVLRRLVDALEAAAEC